MEPRPRVMKIGYSPSRDNYPCPYKRAKKQIKKLNENRITFEESLRRAVERHNLELQASIDLYAEDQR